MIFKIEHSACAGLHLLQRQCFSSSVVDIAEQLQGKAAKVALQETEYKDKPVDKRSRNRVLVPTMTYERCHSTAETFASSILVDSRSTYTETPS